MELSENLQSVNVNSDTDMACPNTDTLLASEHLSLDEDVELPSCVTNLPNYLHLAGKPQLASLVVFFIHFISVSAVP